MFSLQLILEKIKGFFTEPGLPGRLAVLAMIATGIAQYFMDVNFMWSVILFGAAALFGAFGKALAKWTDNHQVTLGSLLIIAAGFIGDVLAPQSGLDMSPIKELFGDKVFTILEHLGAALLIASRPLVLATNGLDTKPEEIRKDNEFLDGRR